MYYEGSQIGPYTLIRLIGRGGFGEVWLAERRTELVTTQFAVKLPMGNTVDLAAIKQEATIWARVSGHPNVVPIIEANIYDGQTVIVSEYAADGSLASRLRSTPVMSVSQAVEMVIGILNGLEFLHSREIIHRDLKPENILLQGSTPRLADFGISRAVKATSISSTIMGTPAFMAPETFDGKRTRQTDIWSAGVILYLLLTGRLPFPQEQTTELIAAIIWREPELLPLSIPTALRDIVARALAKNPEQRYRLAEEMRRDLLLAANTLSGVTEPFWSAGGATEASAGQSITDPSLIETTDGFVTPVLSERKVEAMLTRRVKSKQVSRWIVVAGGILVVLLFIGGLLTLGIYSIPKLLHAVSTAPKATASPEIFLTTARSKEVLTKIDNDNGGSLKMLWIVIYPDELYVIVHDSKIAENYDRYIYKAGAFTKEPDFFNPNEYWDHKEFSLAEVNFEVLPTVVSVAKGKAQNLEGGKIDMINISKAPSGPKDKVGRIQWSIYLSGTRKDQWLTFDEKGIIVEKKH